VDGRRAAPIRCPPYGSLSVSVLRHMALAGLVHDHRPAAAPWRLAFRRSAKKVIISSMRRGEGKKRKRLLSSGRTWQIKVIKARGNIGRRPGGLVYEQFFDHLVRASRPSGYLSDAFRDCSCRLPFIWPRRQRFWKPLVRGGGGGGRVADILEAGFRRARAVVRCCGGNDGELSIPRACHNTVAAAASLKRGPELRDGRSRLGKLIADLDLCAGAESAVERFSHPCRWPVICTRTARATQIGGCGSCSGFRNTGRNGKKNNFQYVPRHAYRPTIFLHGGPAAPSGTHAFCCGHALPCGEFILEEPRARAGCQRPRHGGRTVGFAGERIGFQ